MSKQHTDLNNSDEFDLTPELTELVAGYHEARSRLADIFSSLKLGHKVTSNSDSDTDWLMPPDQLRDVLDYVKSHNLLSKTDPPLITIKKVNGEEFIDMDNLIIAMIIDSYISEGNYETNRLQSIRRAPGFINENWYRVIDKLQWLLFKRMDREGATSPKK